MSKDPAILFYTSDFLTGTMTMSNEQVGKYIRLLCLQHQKGFLSEKDMLFICQSYDEDIYSKFIKTDQGFCNERLRLESEKRALYSLSRASNRSKSNKKQPKKHMKKICKSYVQHMENENINENINININKKECKNERFDEFWKSYPKKKAKADAEKAFNKINPDEQLFQVILSAVNKSKTTEDWLKEKGKFIPFPASWLNGKRWLDEEIEQHPLAGRVSDKTIRNIETFNNWRPPQ